MACTYSTKTKRSRTSRLRILLLLCWYCSHCFFLAKSMEDGGEALNPPSAMPHNKRSAASKHADAHNKKRHLLDFFAQRPEKDELKCCVCEDLSSVKKDHRTTPSLSRCTVEAHKIVRNKIGRRKSGKTCKEMCTSFGRNFVHKENLACEAAFHDHAPPPACASLSLPRRVSRCCGCGHGSGSGELDSDDAAPTCVVPTRKVYKSRLGGRIGGSTCEESCAFFGRIEWADASTTKVASVDGFCAGEDDSHGDGSNALRNLAHCATVHPLLPNDVFPMKPKGLTGSRDRFDVVKWIQTHFVGALFDPNVVSALESIRADVLDDSSVAESEHMATVAVEQSGEERTNFYISTFSSVKSFVLNAMKYGGTLATLSHHARLGVILMHASGTVNHVLAHLVFPVHIPLTLFTYIAVPWSKNVQETLALLKFSPKVVAITSCTEHYFSPSQSVLFRGETVRVDRLSNTMQTCGDSAISTIRTLLTETKDAILEFVADMKRDASCIAGDFSSMHRKCFSLVQPSLTGLPDGLWTEFALRLDVWAMMVDALTAEDCCKEVGLVRSLYGLLDDRIRSRLEASMRVAFVLNGDDESDKTGTACRAAILALSLQKQMFEAFVRTARDFFSQRARTHWRVPSLDFGGMDGSFSEGLTTVHPCANIFSSDGSCRGRGMLDVGLVGYRACSKAHDGPLWFQK
eukprot:g3850.t1